jgi:hypothetical protein
MKNWLPFLAAVLLLTAVSPVAAIPVHGTFGGVVTEVNGVGGIYPVGTTVAGSYGYDSALLNGNQTGSFTDPSVFFFVSLNGQPFAYYIPLLSGLSFSVDASGVPMFGSAASTWNLALGEGGFLGLFGGPGDSYYRSRIIYDAPTVPDATTTSCLMGIALASLAGFRRVIR